MMIRYLKHEDIDKKKWDSLIRQAFNGNIYAYSWYLDIIHPYWDALIENDYERIMPVTSSSKWGTTYMLQPFFAQQLGVFSKTKLTPQNISRFIEALPKEIKFTEVNLNSYNKPESCNGSLIPHKNFLLDLINTHGRIKQHYSTNLKRNLKKAAKAELQLTKTTKPEELVKLFRENRGKEVRHWKDNHYIRLQHLMYMAIHKGKGVLFGVYSKHNSLIAGAFFLKSHHKLTFLFSGQSTEGKSHAALSFIIDSVIEQFSPGNYTLDFEGSDNPGLARYYKGFGANETTYYGIRINKLPFPQSFMYTIKRWLE